MLPMRLRQFIWSLFPFIVAALAGCGGDDSDSFASIPSSPRNLAVTIGEETVGMSWDPPDSDGGAPVQAYVVSIVSDLSSVVTQVANTSTVVELDLESGVRYTIGVAARNRVGAGPIASIIVTPGGTVPTSYTPLTIQGDASPSGIFDPSVIRLDNGQMWMAYSSVSYYKERVGSGSLVQDVGIRLARSDDGGKTFRLASTVAMPEPATISDTDPQLRACGAPTCSGRWVYETASLVEDTSDPDPSRRFKLFAHQYFLYPPGSVSTLYHLGSIVMWTAPAPDATWSAPQSVLGWNLTPPELTAPTLANALHGDLASCIALSEGGVAMRGGTLDLVLSCVYPGGDPLPQKVVLLRSTDHAKTFQYVSTLLTPQDAAAFGAVYFTAPSLAPLSGQATVLIATPAVEDGIYAGCAVFALEDTDRGALFRKDDVPVRLSSIAPVADHFSGACAWDRSLGTTGVLLNEVIPGAEPADTKFRILRTGRSL